MMIYEKTMSRKVIVGNEKKEGDSSNGTTNETNGNPAANGTSSKPTTNSSNEAANGTKVNRSANAETSKKPASGTEPPSSHTRAAKLKVFKELFWGSPETKSAKTKGPASTGQVLNLVRTDASEIAQRFREIDRMIRVPFSIIFAVWLIWSLLGPSCLVAIAVIIIAQILNGLIARLQVRWRRNTKKANDARVQISSQYIGVIRHLRWYSWEETWLGKVMEARQHELNIRIVSMILNLTSYFILIFSGAIFPVVAFFAYTAFAGHQLRIDLIFPALQLFGNLQGSLREMPTLITTLLNAYVAMERIEDFTKEPEKEGASNREEDTTPSVESVPLKLSDSSFAWPGSDTTILQDVSLTIEPGLTVVYGKIGSGKTALLQALLGEMDRLSGQVDIPDKMIGYCSQSPWLQSISIRDNILFFSEYEEERYENVLDACALRQDLANFKDGDLSEIGEK
jgi:ABC-type multidrug transport system fused ATPase/permease subunit